MISNRRFLTCLAVPVALALWSTTNGAPPTKNAPATVSSEVTNVFIVRHAEKEDEPSRDPGLSAIGVRRAEQLRDNLRSVRLAAVYETQWLRTQQTAVPTAEDQKITPTRLDALAVDAVVQAVRTQHVGESILVVSHSNVIPKLLEQLRVPKSWIPKIPEGEFDHLFIVTLTSAPTPILTHLHYGLPTS